MITLSILCPTLPNRKEQFERLLFDINTQRFKCYSDHPVLGRAEFLYDDSPSFLEGGLSIGKKRQALVKRATGKYLCFLDDDDTVSPNYIESILRLCYEQKDIGTFRSFTKTGYYWTIIDMSLNNTHNEQASPDFIIKRKPFHICPVRTEFAKLYEFEDINYGEDSEWMDKVLTHCTTEAHTDAVIHQYNHSINSEADKITNYRT